MMKKLSLCTILILALLLAACSSGQLDTATTTDVPPMAAEFEMFADAAPAEAAAPTIQREASVDMADNFAGDAAFDPVYAANTPAPRMVIRSADMALATYNFEDTITGMENILTNRGGFIESSHQWMAPAGRDDELLWRAEFILRVPVGLFDQVNRELVALAHIQRLSTASEDVTLEFSDLGSRLRIREEELRRVELMLDAATELTDIINLEAQLTTLRLAVDAYSRRMTEIDHLASFSTIGLTVYEVMAADDADEDADEDALIYPIADVDDTFGTRFRHAFSASLDLMTGILAGLAIFIAWAGLPLLLLGIVAFITIKILKKSGWRRAPFRNRAE